MQIKFWHILILMAVSFGLGWLLAPSGDEIIRNVTQKHYNKYATDTVEKYVKVTPPGIDLANLKPRTITDTLIIRETDSVGIDSAFVNDLVEQYECLREKLINEGFERIKTFEEVTDSGDSVRIEFASIKDEILKLELKLAAREVATDQLHSYWIPDPDENKEAWYIHPAIAAGGMVLGYVLRGND